MEFHELANIFPMMNNEEYQKLKADIQTNGFDASLPIILHENKILDGRNRYKACEELGIKQIYVNFNGDDPLSYVVRTNLHRRHLQPGQLAFVALDVEKHYAKQAKEKELERKEKQFIPKEQTTLEIFPKSEPESIHARKEAAKEVGVNERYISDAKKIQNVAPELAEKIIAGEMTIPEAKREIKKKANYESKKTPKPFTGKYQVIYADPPWSYNNSGFTQSAASQYPTMAIDEICELHVSDIADNDAVLFLWATSPLLPDALKVIIAWGFEYKASIIWVKDKAPGMGWWVNTKHEILLIASKSNNHPLEKFDSVVEESVTRHSKKPNVFYSMIEKMYTGAKIELFAREKREGWEVWGNEPDIDS